MLLQNLFGHYFPPPESPGETFSYARFVFDTNVFLDLYRLGPVARAEVLAALRSTVKPRLWVPYHVLLEVSKNRTSLVLEASDRQRENLESVESARKQARDALQTAAIAQSLEAAVLADALQTLDKAFQRIADEVNTRQEGSTITLADDEILQFINEVLAGQDVSPPDQNWYEEAAREAAQRATKRLPPGYKDERKDEVIRAANGTLILQKYGDFYIWKELIEEVKRRPVDFEHVIFVTSDRKEDWWEVPRGKAQGARPELRLEIQEAGAKTFRMYQLTRLVEFLRAGQRKDEPGSISERTVADVREVEQQAETAGEPFAPQQAPAWAQLISRAGEEGFRGYQAQRAVEGWLGSVFVDHTIHENPGFPDLVVRLNEGRSHGFEVVTPRNPGQLRALIYGKLKLARAWIDRLGGLLTQPEDRNLTFVITLTPRVASGSMAESFFLSAADEMASELSGEADIRLLIGRVEGDKFTPISEFS